MKKHFVTIIFLFLAGNIIAGDIAVVEDKKSGTLTVDNNIWKFAFNTKNNMLMVVAKSNDSKNILSTVDRGAAQWVYLYRDKRIRAVRQRHVKSPSKHRILKSDKSEVSIHLSTLLDAFQIEETYSFLDNGTINHTYEIEAIKNVAGLMLFCWEAKLGSSGESLEPFDRFIWGKGEALLRNEKELKPIRKISRSIMRASGTRNYSTCCWLNPADLKKRFIALQNSRSGEYWMLAFKKNQKQSKYFLGDMAEGGYSQWFGFRVHGQVPYTNKMPTYYIEKGTKWSGTVGHILDVQKTGQAFSAIYEKWLAEKVKNR